MAVILNITRVLHQLQLDSRLILSWPSLSTKHNMAGFHSTSVMTVSLSLTTAANHCDQPAS